MIIRTPLIHAMYSGVRYLSMSRKHSNIKSTWDKAAIYSCSRSISQMYTCSPSNTKTRHIKSVSKSSSGNNTNSTSWGGDICVC